MELENDTSGPRLSNDDVLEAKRLLGKILDRLDGSGQATQQTGTERASFADRVYKGRRLRNKYFPEELFADPACDILLLLYSLEHAGKRVSLSAVCMSAGVPETTGHRWIERLINAGLVFREKHPHDRRVYWLRLNDHTLSRLDAYFDDMVGSYFRT